MVKVKDHRREAYAKELWESYQIPLAMADWFFTLAQPKGSLSEPIRRRKWYCLSCGAEVEHVFFYDSDLPWHYGDLLCTRRCGPCIEGPRDETPNEH